MAGRPEMMRYTLMHSTKATATMPHSRKSRCMNRSRTSFAPLVLGPPCAPSPLWEAAEGAVGEEGAERLGCNVFSIKTT